MPKHGSRRKLRPKVVEKQEATATPFPLRSVITKKKARTPLQRRHRSRISPILFSPSNPAAVPPPFFTPIPSVAAAAGNHDHDRSGELISPESRKRKSTEIEAVEGRPESSPADRTIITRYYSKRRRRLSRVATNFDLGVTSAGSMARVLEMQNGAGDSNLVPETKNGAGDSDLVLETNVQKLSSNSRELRRVRSEVKQSEDGIRGTPEVHESHMTHKSSRSEFPKQEADEISVDESAFVDQTPNSLAWMEGELACLEQFSCEEVESTLLESGSQFSQKADSDDSSSSPTQSDLVAAAAVGDTDLSDKSSVTSSSPLLFSSSEISSLLVSSIFLATSVLVFDLLVTFYS